MSNIEKPSQKLEIARKKHEIELYLFDKLREEEWEDLVNDHYVEKLLDGPLSCSKVHWRPFAN